MSSLILGSLMVNKGVRRNSYYDERKNYTQRELDKYRISEGHSKEIRILSDKQYNKK